MMIKMILLRRAIQICWTDDLSHRKTMAPLCFEILTASKSSIHYMKFVDLSFITHSYNTFIDNFINIDTIFRAKKVRKRYRTYKSQHKAPLCTPSYPFQTFSRMTFSKRTNSPPTPVRTVPPLHAPPQRPKKRKTVNETADFTDRWDEMKSSETTVESWNRSFKMTAVNLKGPSRDPYFRGLNR